ncbi:MAG: L,D-transpeptidase [Rhodobacter sp.]|jgi:lipoprotein-anchoring transpeptidase ErfK/SrfK|nr:L,D-transpeptidase [Rhodobacter sp.]MBK8439848.1 L,D-transpeptidase [Rhodobacter sp.]
MADFRRREVFLLRSILTALVLALLICGAAGQALAERVEVRISLSRQQMEVFHEGRKLYQWSVSTAKAPKITPTGSWIPQALSANHRSRLYNNAPMPWSVFYHGNYAIHGTTAIKQLGRPASHGCVRLHPDNAKILFRMVRAEGLANTRVTIFR